MDKKTKTKNFLEYLNTAGIAAFCALTLVQTVFALSWLAKNIFAPKNGKEFYFHYKETGSFVLMAAVVFILTMTIVKKVAGSKTKFFCYGTVVLYVMTLPTVLSVNFNATLYAICVSLLMLLVFFALRYFYGDHTRRLWCLIGIFALLVVLSYLNRGAFWIGVFITFLFLTITLIRNIGIKGRNMADKSWRNTLLLFCILVIIMLMPQYFTYNNINHTLYHQPTKEQIAARVIIPYLDYEKDEKNEEYLLGVIRNADYDSGHSYRNFKKIIHRYEEDNLDMDVIWKNLYTNAYYRYKKTIAKRYIRDVVRGLFAPLLVESEMKSETLVTHHGYYYAAFEENCPKLADSYFSFGLKGLFVTALIILGQALVSAVIRLSALKQELKPEEGKHKKIEAVVLVLCLGISWTVVQTLFALEGTSFVSSIGSTIVWVLLSSFIWFENKENN